MSSLSPEILERYVAYKQSVLGHYNHLLEQHNLISSTLLLNMLKEVEQAHKEGIIANGNFSCPADLDFSRMLALTPIDEFSELSQVFKEIIQLKETAMQEHFSDIETRDEIRVLKAIEHDIHNKLIEEKSKYHI